MALPSGKIDARAAYQTMVDMRESISLQTAAIRQACINGDGKPQLFVGFHNFLMTIAPQWNALKDVPGLAAYVAEREADETYDVVAAYNAVNTAGTACVQFIRSSLRQDANGGIVMWERVGGNYVTIAYPASSLTGFVTLLDDLLTAAG